MFEKNDLHESGRILTKEEFIEKVTNDPKFGDRWGDLGPIYGKQWRKWDNYNKYDADPTEIDQIQNILDDLVNNPDSRRMMVNAWNVGELDQMTLPPCHVGFQVYTRELNLNERVEFMLIKNIDTSYLNSLDNTNRINWMNKNNIPKRSISLMWNQRSVDTPLGLPFNIASYGLLLEMLAQEVKQIPDELIGNLGDVHIYLNQVEGVKEQLKRTSKELPKIKLQDGMHCCLVGDSQDVVIEGYNPHPAIKFPLSN